MSRKSVVRIADHPDVKVVIQNQTTNIQCETCASIININMYVDGKLIYPDELFKE